MYNYTYTKVNGISDFYITLSATTLNFVYFYSLLCSYITERLPVSS